MIWYDYYYIILVMPAILLSLIAQIAVKSTYRKMSRIKNVSGLTGAAAAEKVLSYYGISNVKIEPVNGNLTDHYDPSDNVIRLSSKVFFGNSIAAVGIACHEAGHAAQHAEGYAPIRIRNAILPIANIGSSAGIWLAVIGYILGYGFLTNLGIILFSAVVVFQLVTLPIEFNASARAMRVIDETGMLREEEQRGARRVLTAAAMTYVAALLVSIMSLLRLILRYNSKSDRR